ncbi:MAG: hypothetical protein C0467_21760 [Planctomycetaceae bacterium]|nr:hypothetical protein [Planctomycetaceae bacterium]
MSSPTDLFPPPEPGIDAIVRAQLDAEAAQVDPARIWDRVRVQLDAEAARPITPRSGFRKVLFAVGALAASLLAAVFLLGPSREAIATPTQVVESARAANGPDADRCYTQTLQLPPNSPAPLALVLDSGRTVTLCTRGDRFVVQPGFGGRGACGRDENGRVWIAPTRDAAARFDESELPPLVRDAVRIRGLELGTLLDEVLKDFELSWTEPPVHNAALLAVSAVRRGQTGPGQIRSADIVVEHDTKRIRSLVLRRQLIVGDTATITFRLAGIAQFGAVAYAAEGHVDAGRPVYDGARPLLRRKVLLQNLGDVLVNGL